MTLKLHQLEICTDYESRVGKYDSKVFIRLVSDIKCYVADNLKSFITSYKECLNFLLHKFWIYIFAKPIANGSLLFKIVSAEKKNGQVKAIILSEVEQGLKNWNDFIHFYKDWLKRTEMEMPGNVIKHNLEELLMHKLNFQPVKRPLNCVLWSLLW